MSCLKPISLVSIAASGELRERMLRNFGRLEEPYYRPPQVFANQTRESWPGDTEGMLILALTLLSQATGREAKYLQAVIESLPQHMNEQGYFGPVMQPPVFEQQLSGHGWLLRGLCEYYEWKHDAGTRKLIDNVIANLVVPASAYLRTYPIDPTKRVHGAKDLGTNAGVIGDWNLSTDIGCTFILLDGMVHAYQLFGGDKLEGAIEATVAMLGVIDLVAIKAHTHSSLTAARSLVRLHEITSEQRYLEKARQIAESYLSTSITEAFGNYNWFNRPDTWTEPCGIADSFVLLVELWKHTGSPRYLEFAHLIYFNALGHGQRGNGGFGPDSCAGGNGPFLKPGRSYEAHYCCSMNGGTGLSRAAQYCCFTDGDTVTVPFFHDNEVELTLKSGSLKLRTRTGYPFRGTVSLEVVRSSMQVPVSLRLFVPSWASEQNVQLNQTDSQGTLNNGFLQVDTPLSAGDTLVLTFELHTGSRPTVNPNSTNGYHAFFHGPLLLGVDTSVEMPLRPDTALVPVDSAGAFSAGNSRTILSPVNALWQLRDREAEMKCCKQVLFRKQLQ